MLRYLFCVLFLSLLLAACTSVNPAPPPTPDIPATVEAQVQARLEAQSTPVPVSTVRLTNTPQPSPTLPPTLAVTPKSTPKSTNTSGPTPASVEEGLDPVDCSNCAYDTVPVIGNVEWLEPPIVTDAGVLTLRAKIKEGYKLTRPGLTNPKSNVTLTNGGNVLFGIVLPASGSGWSWGDDPGLWIAETHSYRDDILRVRANIDPKAANQAGLTLCVWTGGRSSAENKVLACKKVERP